MKYTDVFRLINQWKLFKLIKQQGQMFYINKKQLDYSDRWQNRRNFKAMKNNNEIAR